jgi:hypothetical protein
MDPAELQEAFPTDDPLPQPLLRLCEYDEQADGSISCDFEVAEASARKLGLYFGDEQLGSSFAVFGQDELLSFYAFWLYEGKTLADAPVVYLSGEAEGTTVLANTFEEFLGLLGLGRESVGNVGQWDDAAEPCANAVAFREWLKSELGIEPPADPAAVVAAAKQAHPDLAAWIDERQEE